MRLIIAGGGTGGHLYPAIAVAKEFRKQEPRGDILFIGTEQGLECRILPGEGFALRTLPTAGWVGHGWGARWRVLRQMPRALIQSWKILREFCPDVVVGVGGYASGPFVVSAVLYRKPTVILEQNALPGVTNFWLSIIVDRVVLAFEDSRKYLKRTRGVLCLGNPVREEIYDARQRGIPGEPRTLLVVGGSRGARALNRAMVDAAPIFAEGSLPLNIMHQTGTEDHAWVRKAYQEHGVTAEVLPYFSDMGIRYRRADLVVARAGATTVAELTAAARPALLIPYPHAARNHQMENARLLQAAGGAEVIPEEELSGSRLANRIVDLMSHSNRLVQMAEQCGRLARPDAARDVVNLCRAMNMKKRLDV